MAGTRAARDVLVLALVHAASRVVFAAGGVRFDASPLGWFWQYLDPELLRTDLLRSLWQLHAQPPLFNAFLGLVLQAAGAHATAVFHAVFLAAGFALAACLYALLRRLGLGRGAALGVAIAWDLSPTAVLYEHVLFYPLFEALALAAAMLFLHRACAGRRAADAAAFFAAIAALALTRSLFHVSWFAASAALGAIALRPLRPLALAACALGALAVAGVYAKNAWLFDVPGASSWAGMNLASLTRQCWTPAEIADAVRGGRVSPLVAVPPFSSLDAYPSAWQDPGPAGAPALAARAKPSGEPNYNQISYVAIARQYGRDARAMIALAPGRYARCVGRAWRRFLVPPSDDPIVGRNRSALAIFDQLYDALVYGVPRAWTGRAPARTDPLGPVAYPDPANDAGELCWLWAAAGGAAWIHGMRRVARSLRRRRDRAGAAALAFALLAIAYVACAANAIELAENNRFRVAIEPLVVVLIAIGARDLVHAREPTSLAL